VTTGDETQAAGRNEGSELVGLGSGSQRACEDRPRAGEGHVVVTLLTAYGVWSTGYGYDISTNLVLTLLQVK
jgi:hypothetical protein